MAGCAPHRLFLQGDLLLADCGVSAAMRGRMRRHVSYVVHCAASIIFNEHVHTLLANNYQVHDALQLCVLIQSCTARSDRVYAICLLPSYSTPCACLCASHPMSQRKLKGGAMNEQGHPATAVCPAVTRHTG